MPSVDNPIECSVCCNECSVCCNWFHYNTCESMSREESDRHCDDLNASYVCLSCMVGSVTGVLETGSIGEGDATDNSCSDEGPCTKQITPLAVGGACVVISNAPLDLTHDNRQSSSQLSVVPVSPDMGIPKPMQVTQQPQAVQVLTPKLQQSAEKKLPGSQDSSLGDEKVESKDGDSSKSAVAGQLDPKKKSTKKQDGQPKVKEGERPKLTSTDTSDVEQPLSSQSGEAVDQTNDTLADQMLKSKEKSFKQKERKRKDAEKKLHLKEISLADQIDQNEHPKAYILTMENKLKELETSNRLLRMKMLSQIDLDENCEDRPSPQSKEPKNNHSGVNPDLHKRMAHVEFKLLENRINQLEDNFNSYSYCPHWVPCHYYPYHTFCHQYQHLWPSGHYTAQSQVYHQPYSCDPNLPHSYSVPNPYEAYQQFTSEYLYDSLYQSASNVEPMANPSYTTASTASTLPEQQAPSGIIFLTDVDENPMIAGDTQPIHNSNYHIKFIDDQGPLPPVQPLGGMPVLVNYGQKT